MKARGHRQSDEVESHKNRPVNRGSAGTLKRMDKGGLKEQEPAPDPARLDHENWRGSTAGEETDSINRAERAGGPGPAPDNKPGFDRGDLPPGPGEEATGVRVNEPGLKPKIEGLNPEESELPNVGVGNTRGPAGIGGSEALGTDADISAGAAGGRAARNSLHPDSDLSETSGPPDAQSLAGAPATAPGPATIRRV